MKDRRHGNAVCRTLSEKLPEAELGWHVHNLAGMATANILAALDGGARFVEGAICGIGGGIVMPTTMGSVGNFPTEDRSEEHTSELQSLMRISYAVFCLQKKTTTETEYKIN